MNSEDLAWSFFEKSGKIQDYLNYIYIKNKNFPSEEDLEETYEYNKKQVPERFRNR